MNNIETIPISNETKKKLDELRRNDWSDEKLVVNIIEFAYLYRKSWYEYATKFPQWGMESLDTIYVTRYTYKRLKEICDSQKDTINNVIRGLISHAQSCLRHHKAKSEYVIRVGDKAKEKFFIHKPGSWTNDRFLVSLLVALEKNEKKLEEFQ